MSLIRSALIMTAMTAIPCKAEPSRLLTPTRTVAQEVVQAKEFVGLSLASLGRLILIDGGTKCSDRFRRDVIQIWSESTQSKWFLLPPKRLGRAANGMGV